MVLTKNKCSRNDLASMKQTAWCDAFTHAIYIIITLRSRSKALISLGREMKSILHSHFNSRWSLKETLLVCIQIRAVQQKGSRNS